MKNSHLLVSFKILLITIKIILIRIKKIKSIRLLLFVHNYDDNIIKLVFNYMWIQN